MLPAGIFLVKLLAVEVARMDGRDFEAAKTNLFYEWLAEGRRTAVIESHRIFFASTAAVVWLTHRSVLRRAGHSGRSFLRSCQAQYAFYLEPTGALASSHEFASR
jgi:hypothetical protein